MKDKIDKDDKITLSDTIKSALQWMEENTSATKEIYDNKRKEVETIANPIISKVYQNTGDSGSSSGSSGESTSSADDTSADDPSSAGPTVEEVD